MRILGAAKIGDASGNDDGVRVASCFRRPTTTSADGGGGGSSNAGGVNEHNVVMEDGAVVPAMRVAPALVPLRLMSGVYPDPSTGQGCGEGHVFALTVLAHEREHEREHERDAHP